jgi:hypothetical membrane protein
MQSNSIDATRTFTITRLLLTFGVVGPLLFIVVFLVEGATRSGYSVMRNQVSALGMTSLGWMQETNFLVYGLFMLGFAIGVRSALRRGRGAVAGPVLFGIYAVALIVAGLWVTDPGNGYPPGVVTPAKPTTHGLIHGGAGGIVFLSLTIVIFVMSRRFAGDPGSRQWMVYSLATGCVVLVFFVLSVGPWFPSALGLFQRIAIISGWCWVAMVASRLRRQIQGTVPVPVVS